MDVIPLVGGLIILILIGTLVFIFTTVSAPMRYPWTSEILDVCGTGPRSITLITSDISQEYELIESKLKIGEPPYVMSLPEPICSRALEKGELKGTRWVNYTKSCNYMSSCCDLVSPINEPSARDFLDVIMGCYYSGGLYRLHPEIRTFNELRYGYTSSFTITPQLSNQTIRHSAYISKAGCLYICK